MKEIPTTAFTGKSGKIYIFTVYEIDKSTLHDKSPDEGGVYLFAKKHSEFNGKYKYKAVNIGISNSCETRHKNHHQEECIKGNGADCMCFLKEERETERIRIEKDLLEAIYTPCNTLNNN